jgi:hypothetical protein
MKSVELDKKLHCSFKQFVRIIAEVSDHALGHQPRPNNSPLYIADYDVTASAQPRFEFVE